MGKKKGIGKSALSFEFKTKAEKKAHLDRCAPAQGSYDPDVRLGTLETNESKKKMHPYPKRD